MSVLSASSVVIAGQVEDVLLRQGRSIGTLIPGVTIDEQHVDDLMITSHPVAIGGNISDHAVKQPSTLIMRCGWSESGNIFNFDKNLQLAPGPLEAYKQLQALQNNRQPISVVTGKRLYENMLIRRLTVVTDVETENALIAEVEFQQIIIADTTTVGSSVNVGSTVWVSPDTVDNTMTQPPVNLGSKQTVDVTSSLSSSDATAIGGMIQ